MVIVWWIWLGEYDLVADDDSAKMALTTLPIDKLLPVIISNYDKYHQKNLKKAALMQDCNTLTVCTPVQLLGDDLPVQLNFRAPRY